MHKQTEVDLLNLFKESLYMQYFQGSFSDNFCSIQSFFEMKLLFKKHTRFNEGNEISISLWCLSR